MPPYPGGYGYPPGQRAARTNPLAIAALVCGIVNFMCYITWVPALILGFIAKGQIDRDPEHETGRGLAIAGIVLGFIGLALTVLAVVLIVVGLSPVFMDGFREGLQESGY